MAAVVIAGLVVVGCGSDDDGGGADTASRNETPEPTAVRPSPTPAVPPPLWPLPAAPSANIAAAGLQALPTEILTYHVHAHLDIFVNGQPATVAEFIGIDLVNRLISPLHTHDTSGIIHIEAAAPQVFTLGQVFIEWGVRLNASCVADFCEPQTDVRAFVNGSEVTVDPATIELQDHQEIALVVGQMPANVPSSYRFPPGY